MQFFDHAGRTLTVTFRNPNKTVALTVAGADGPHAYALSLRLAVQMQGRCPTRSAWRSPVRASTQDAAASDRTDKISRFLSIDNSLSKPAQTGRAAGLGLGPSLRIGDVAAPTLVAAHVFKASFLSSGGA